jgi:hypothetical protein
MGLRYQSTIGALSIFVGRMASSLASGPRTFVAVIALFNFAPENIMSYRKTVSMNGH